MAGSNLEISRSTNVPLGLFLDFCLAGSQSPIGQIPNLQSHQDFAQGLYQGLTTAHKNITFVICNLCFMHCLGFFSSKRRRFLSFSQVRKSCFSFKWIQSHILIRSRILRIPEVHSHFYPCPFVLLCKYRFE